MGKIKVAIIGVGNCASSLVQGIHKYVEIPTNEEIPGVMHNTIGDYRIEDILRMVEYNENIIGLNLLENLSKYIEKDNLIRDVMIVYQNYTISDIIDTFMISNHLWELRGYSTILSIYNCYLLKKKNIKSDIKLPYNKYISKSLINVHSNNIYK